MARLAGHTMIYTTGQLATRAIAFLLLPLYTNTLAPADYGVLSLAFTFAAFCQIICQLGLDSAFMRYYISAPAGDKPPIFSTLYLLQATAAVIIAALIWLLRGPLALQLLDSGRADWMGILAGIILLDTLWAYPLHLLRAEGRARGYVVFALANALLTVALNLVLVGLLQRGVTGALHASLISSGLLVLGTAPLVWRRFRLGGLSRRILRTALTFGLPFMAAGLFAVTMEQADRYLLRWLGDLETVGIYTAGYRLGMVMLLVVMGFSRAWQPFFLRRGQDEDAPALFARVSVYVAAGMSWAALLATVWMDELLHFRLGGLSLLGARYGSAGSIVPIILLGYVFFGLYVLQLPGIHLTGRTGWIVVLRGSGALVNVALNLAFIPLWGITGAAWATCIAFGVMALSIHLVNRRIYPIPYSWSRLGRVGALVALGWGLHAYWPDSLGSHLLISALFPAGLWLTGAIPGNEWRALFRSLFRPTGSGSSG